MGSYFSFLSFVFSVLSIRRRTSSRVQDKFVKLLFAHGSDCCLASRSRDRTSPPKSMNPIQIPSEAARRSTSLASAMVIRVHGRDTGGSGRAVETHDVPGGGPPPHIHHREDETFQMLEGEYEWTVGGKTFSPKRARPCLHRARSRTPTVTSARRPAGSCASSPQPEFKGFFEDIGALSPQQQQDIPCVMAIAKKFGLEFSPPPGA